MPVEQGWLNCCHYLALVSSAYKPSEEDKVTANISPYELIMIS